jgi:peptidoglycan/LPS O-acetylase OafA/YrhL
MFWFIWIAGAYASVAWPLRLPRPAVWLAGAATVASLAVSPFLDQRIADILIGVSFALFLVDGTAATVTRSYAIDRRLAGFSYSFYVVHLPVMVFLAGVANNLGLLPIGGVPISAVNFLYVLIFIACAGAVAFVFGEVFEGRTERLRGVLRRQYMAITGQTPAAPK